MAEKKHEFDVVVIGGGPGGYVAAIKAAQLGKKVACVEMRGSLGGTCLNVGCIPSKALLQSSHKYHEVEHEMSAHGIEIKSVKLSVKKMMERKQGVVSSLNKGIEGLFAKNKVTYFKGKGSFISNSEIKVELADGKVEHLIAANTIIATGSEVTPLPGITIDEKNIVSSTGALEFEAVPEKLLVIGGGYIGLELGSVWSRLGSKVKVAEFMDRVVPAMDLDISKEFQKILTAQGIEFSMKTKVVSAEVQKNGSVKVTMEPAAGGQATSEVFDKVLVAIGRRPFTQGLGLETIGVEMAERGCIKTTHDFKTNVAGVYAIGDVITGPMLAHKAEEEGVAVAEIIAGQHGHVNYKTIPGVVYTHPEVASVGMTEQQAKEAGLAYKASKFPFMANSRARANGDFDGFVKVIADKNTDEILGAHIIGPQAGDLITELVLAMEYKAASEDVARTCHPHPSLAEAVKEACLGVFGKPIHM